MRRQDRYIGYIPKQHGVTPRGAAAQALIRAALARKLGKVEQARVFVGDAKHLRLKRLGKVASSRKRGTGDPLTCIFCTAQYQSSSSMERHMENHA